MTAEEFWKILHDTAPPAKISYKLYHDNQGMPLFYSMDHVPGTYIEIDQNSFAQGSMRVRVQDGKLVEVPWKTVSKLVPDMEHGSLCHQHDISVIVDQPPGQRWTVKTYETR